MRRVISYLPTYPVTQSADLTCIMWVPRKESCTPSAYSSDLEARWALQLQLQLAS